ncbi:MAG TPA: diacylglycerol kinase [Sphingomonas sp.]|uniref:diacylglycerol kinase n=1 Tax=Sphingomonas sp. TaxID=28214 RepID=UPI002C97359E|nr:diacylglycerol kinase [Sphingomonas sp.]HMI20805.1 diacylglycerol kinase [Sphingomonas sp.]
MKNRPLHQRLGFAFAGLRSGWLRERSFRTHCLFALAALTALVVLRPAAIWWALVALVAAMVMALELINSAIEGVIDLLHPAQHPEIKIIKDMVAGAVLIVSVAALIVAAALLVASL